MVENIFKQNLYEKRQNKLTFIPYLFFVSTDDLLGTKERLLYEDKLI